MSAPTLALKTTIRFEGGFFEKDPAATVRQNIRSMLAALVKEGAEDVRDHYPVETGAGRAGVVGRVASQTGKPWFLHGVISETHPYHWAGGGAKRYLGGKSEAKYHMFRRTASRVRAMRAVISADLAKGLE